MKADSANPWHGADTGPIWVVPGLGNSGPTHWQSHWAANYPGLQRVEQANWNHPSLDAWTSRLEEAVAASTEPGWIVAHSLGCLLVAHWARRTRLSLRGALLVAPPDPEAVGFPSEASQFCAVETRTLPFPSLVFTSANDPYDPSGFGRKMAAAWGSTWLDWGLCGHLNAASGHGAWVEGWKVWTEWAKKAQPRLAR